MSERARPEAPAAGEPIGLPDTSLRSRPRPLMQGVYTAYLGLGANIDPEMNLKQAVPLLRKYVRIEAVSRVWETPPFGSHGPNFLNAAARIQTPLSAPLLKTLVLRRIEVQLGRVRTANKNAARTIDLDILVYEGRVLDPKVWTQVFLAVPLAELIPDLADPDSGQTLSEISARLQMETQVFPRLDIILMV